MVWCGMVVSTIRVEKKMLTFHVNGLGYHFVLRLTILISKSFCSQLFHIVIFKYRETSLRPL